VALLFASLVWGELWDNSGISQLSEKEQLEREKCRKLFLHLKKQKKYLVTNK
jgi:hypothetical protein